ncbi:MAG: GtrA family protein [Clostridiales bacterium]|nr:GtrA family protein [Clostridiales bacterium]
MKENSFLSKHREIIVYIIFGILTTLVSWGSYAFFVNVCKLSVSVSNFISWVCGIIFAFLTNKVFVFNSKNWDGELLLKEIGTFVAARLITGVIEWLGVPLLAEVGYDNFFYAVLTRLGISLSLLYTNGLYSKITVSVIVVILNYVFSKLVIFRKREK